MKVFIIIITIFILSLLSFSQEENKQVSKEDQIKAMVKFKEVKITPDPERIKEKEKAKLKTGPVNSESQKIETVQLENTNLIKSKEKTPMGCAETSGPPQELIKKNVKTSATKEDLKQALKDPKPIRKKEK